MLLSWRKFENKHKQKGLKDTFQNVTFFNYLYFVCFPQWKEYGFLSSQTSRRRVDFPWWRLPMDGKGFCYYFGAHLSQWAQVLELMFRESDPSPFSLQNKTEGKIKNLSCLVWTQSHSHLCPMPADPALKPASIFLVWTSHTPLHRTYNTTELCLHSRYDPSHLSTALSLLPHLKTRWKRGRSVKGTCNNSPPLQWTHPVTRKLESGSKGLNRRSTLGLGPLSGERAILPFTGKSRSPGGRLKPKLTITVKEGWMAHLTATKGTVSDGFHWRKKTKRKNKFWETPTMRTVESAHLYTCLAKKQCPGLVLSG